MKLTLLSATVLLAIAPALPAERCQKDISLSAIKDDSQVPIRLCNGATVIIKDLDPIAKSYRLDAKATVVEDGVDLSSLGFIPVPSSGSATKSQPETNKEGSQNKKTKEKLLPEQPDRDKLDKEFTAIRAEVDALGARSDDPLSTYQGKIQDLTQTVSDLTARIAAFRRQSNLEEDRAKTLIKGFIEEIDRVRKNKWPSKEEAALQNDLNDLSNRLAALPVDYSSVFQTWQVEVIDTTTKRTLYDERVKRVAEVQKFVKDAQQTKSDWQAALAKLNPVYERFQRIDDDPNSYFEITYTLQSCSIFGSKTVLTLYSTDLTVDKPQEQSKELATLICDPPLSLSGGFVFSNLDEREYSFVPPATTAAPQAAGDSDASANQIIGLTKESPNSGPRRCFCSMSGFSV